MRVGLAKKTNNNSLNWEIREFAREKNLININTLQSTINLLSREIVQVFYIQYKGGAFSNPTLDEDDTFPPAIYL